MTTAYPAALDDFNNPAASDNLDDAGVVHATQHADVNDAVEAIETALGVNPGAFDDYVPVVVQSGVVTCTVTEARVSTIGSLVFVAVKLVVTGSGTTANAIQVSVPIAARTNLMVAGTMEVFDDSADAGAGVVHAGHAVFATTTAVSAIVDGSNQGEVVGIDPAFGLAVGDEIDMHLWYEAAP